MFYAATSWDETGKSPTQNELDCGIEYLKSYPGPIASNVAIWQPHLENENIVYEIWQWIQYFCSVKIDFQSMLLAEKQVWWLIVPEANSTENNKILNQQEIILKRKDIENQILDHTYFLHEKNHHLYTHYTRAVLPKIYMQVHCLIDYMYRTHSYFPVTLNKMTRFPVEFNLEFGKYFNNIPVLPFAMTSFYNNPKTIKLHKENRQLEWNAGKSLARWQHYTATDNKKNNIQYFNVQYWWDKENFKPGTQLTHNEVDQHFKKIIIEKQFQSNKNLLHFDSTLTDIIV